MTNFDETKIASFGELDDDMLEGVSGGALSNGTVITCRSSMVKYCNGCGRLLDTYQATITGVRGVLDGKTVYWIKRNCCGHKTSVIETAII